MHSGTVCKLESHFISQVSSFQVSGNALWTVCKLESLAIFVISSFTEDQEDIYIISHFQNFRWVHGRWVKPWAIEPFQIQSSLYYHHHFTYKANEWWIKGILQTFHKQRISNGLSVCVMIIHYRFRSEEGNHLSWMKFYPKGWLRRWTRFKAAEKWYFMAEGTACCLWVVACGLYVPKISLIETLDKI